MYYGLFLVPSFFNVVWDEYFGEIFQIYNFQDMQINQSVGHLLHSLFLDKYPPSWPMYTPGVENPCDVEYYQNTRESGPVFIPLCQCNTCAFVVA